jgi:hypothetical protein
MLKFGVCPLEIITAQFPIRNILLLKIILVKPDQQKESQSTAAMAAWITELTRAVKSLDLTRCPERPRVVHHELKNITSIDERRVGQYVIECSRCIIIVKLVDSYWEECCNE